MKISKLFYTFISLLLVFTVLSCTKKEKVENVLYAVSEENVKGLDPITQGSDLYVHRVAGLIFEGMLSYHYLKEPLTLVPAMAEALPTVSKDGLTYTFKLKKGIKFQDDPCFKATGGKGREVTTEDFIYTLKRLSDPSVQTDGFGFIDAKIKGVNEWRKLKGEGKADYSTPIEGLSAPDPYTLVIKLTKPFYQLNYIMAMDFTFVMAKEAVEMYGKELLNHPVGTGPFVLKEWVRNSKIILEKNPTWRGDTYPSDGATGDMIADAGKPIPFVDKIVFTEIIEDQPRWLNFMKGNIDSAGIPKDSFDSVVDRASKQLKPDIAAKGIHMVIWSDGDVTYTCFNMTDPFIGKHKLVRQAMSLALDTSNLIEKFYNGRAVSAQGPIPPAVEGFDPNFKNPHKGKNLEKAKALLVKAGFPGGKGIPELSFETTNSTTGRQIAENFQNDMAAIGIKIKVNVNTWPEMVEKQKTRKAQIVGIAWSADYPDAENFLQLFYSKNASPGTNNSNYNNPEFDKLYDKALVTAPGAERNKIYQKMQSLVAEDSPWIFNVHRMNYTPAHAWVKNFKPRYIVNGYMRYYRIDGELRAKTKPNL